MSYFRWLDGIMDRLSVVVGAFFFSQIPPFMHQYTQQLAGHVSELNHLVNELSRLAASGGKTLEVYIQKFLNSSDNDYVIQGQFMQTIELRYQSFSEALLQLQDSSIWSRPYIFLKGMNYDIAKSTLFTFQPSLPLTVEGFCYITLGIVFGFITYRIISKMIKAICKGLVKNWRRAFP